MVYLGCVYSISYYDDRRIAFRQDASELHSVLFVYMTSANCISLYFDLIEHVVFELLEFAKRNCVSSTMSVNVCKHILASLFSSQEATARARYHVFAKYDKSRWWRVAPAEAAALA